MYLIYKYSIFLTYIYMRVCVCVCVCIYKIINIHSTHIFCKQKLLFWMRLIVSQHYYIIIF